ncbi:MAG: DUF362 domain-containing protein [Sedimentisphaerales bacterium]|nr:DUF362 domain-containing protein [Sedimentisphaerales bacterium]
MKTGNTISRLYYCLARLFFIFTGLLALLWFLIRVIPKPSRAAYPCQRAAFPIASSFVSYVAGIFGTAWVFRLAHKKMRQSYPVIAAVLVFLGLTTAWLTIHIAQKPARGDFVPSDPYNSPIGVARGIHPGRVVWVHDPDATSWDGLNGDWYEYSNTDPNVVEAMISKSLRWLTGQTEDTLAWDELFRHYNQNNGKGNIGYQSGEQIVIKINMNNRGEEGEIDATPHLVYGFLKQLVQDAGINQQAITIYDAIRPIELVSDYCYPDFPNVNYNPSVQWVNDSITYSAEITDSNARRVPQYVLDAEYMINIAILKVHDIRAAVSLCGKNNLGTIYGPSELHPSIRCLVRGMASYDPTVDLIGCNNIGAKTMLYVIDGLYGSDRVNNPPQIWNSPPFNHDWPSSIFVSQDPVAIDSVGLDFLRMEWSLWDNADNYLHEAALADNPPSGTFYDPEGDGTRLQSLGVHEHWNNPIDKQYSRNLGIGSGIELVTGPQCDVVGRYIFYNNSYFDGNDPNFNADDDNAIGIDKQALLPGQIAHFANYTSYCRGINGIIVDMANLADRGNLGDGDFEFRVGNNDDPNSWSMAPYPQHIIVRPGEGVDGSDRVTIIWADNAIEKQWLQVVVMATENTGLTGNDVFYFGNAIGETGNDPSKAEVNAFDTGGVRDHPRNFLSPALIDDQYDFNRDRFVNALDFGIARDNATNFMTALKLINVPNID